MNAQSLLKSTVSVRIFTIFSRITPSQFICILEKVYYISIFNRATTMSPSVGATPLPECCPYFENIF